MLARTPALILSLFCATTLVACGADQSCDAGACVVDPDPDPDPDPDTCADTCAGCCDGETCITATTDAMCGTAGAACAACGVNQECNAGACELIPDPPSGDLWDLYIVSADIPVFSDYGYEWDALSPPDPFVEVYTENLAGDFWYNYSSSKSNTYDPVWNEQMLFEVQSEALENGVVFWFQEDDFSGPEEICLVVLGVDTMLINGQDITSPCPDEPAMSFTWRLEASP